MTIFVAAAFCSYHHQSTSAPPNRGRVSQSRAQYESRESAGAEMDGNILEMHKEGQFLTLENAPKKARGTFSIRRQEGGSTANFETVIDRAKKVNQCVDGIRALNTFISEKNSGLIAIIDLVP